MNPNDIKTKKIHFDCFLGIQDWMTISVKSCVSQINHQEDNEDRYINLTVTALFDNDKLDVMKNRQYVFSFGKQGLILAFLHCYKKSLNISSNDDLQITFKRLSSKMLLIKEIIKIEEK